MTASAPTRATHLGDRAVMRLVRLSGRSWWRATYRDGRTVSEYDTLVNTVLTPLGLGRTSRWEEIPKAGMVALSLLCPDGQVARLEGHEHRFFQLKEGIWRAGETHSTCLRHVIGVVDEPSGGCQCWAWLPPTGRLIAYQDHVRAMGLSFEVQGLRL